MRKPIVKRIVGLGQMVSYAGASKSAKRKFLCYIIKYKGNDHKVRRVLNTLGSKEGVVLPRRITADTGIYCFNMSFVIRQGTFNNIRKGL